MTIHSRIKSLRTQKGWSMETLAEKIQEAEKSEKRLSWQTIQQWENGASAPKRKRLEVVARLLGTTAADLLAGAPPSAAGGPLSFLDLTREESVLVALVRELDPRQQVELQRIANEMHAARHSAKPSLANPYPQAGVPPASPVIERARKSAAKSNIRRASGWLPDVQESSDEESDDVHRVQDQAHERAAGRSRKAGGKR